LVRHADDRELSLNLRDRFPHPSTSADADACSAIKDGIVTDQVLFAITDRNLAARSQQ
jgi:hypothetical protein